MKPNRRYRGERVYIVVWPEHMIVKAGYTSQSRWRSFMSRGATVHRLTLFDSFRAALDYEIALHEYFSRHANLAFPSSADAAWLLGRLGGSCETYRLLDWSVLDRAPQPPSEHVIPTSAADHAHLTCPVGA